MSRIKIFHRLLVCSSLLCGGVKSQIANYISNGGFEDIYNCSAANHLYNLNSWMSIDSNLTWGGMHLSLCNGAIPNQANTTYQIPRTGNTMVLSTFYCSPSLCPTNQRGYLKNRLKEQLQAGKTYCVKFFVNIANTSTYGIDQFSAYFGDSNIDTITKSNIPLTYLYSQINNSIGNVIVDTLGWTLISGTFTASGTEKYCVIGNFKSTASTGTAVANTQYLPMEFSDVCIDDVSCIPLDLPAYAHAQNNVYAIPGNTLYLGRQRDVGIDEACMWYKLPNTTNAIDTAAGITITVAATTETYMVKQDICGMIKYDTVVVHASGLGFTEQENFSHSLSIYPNPADELFTIRSSKENEKVELTITDVNNKILIHRLLNISSHKADMKVDLLNGIYYVNLKNEDGTKMVKKLVIAR